MSFFRAFYVLYKNCQFQNYTGRKLQLDFRTGPEPTSHKIVNKLCCIYFTVLFSQDNNTKYLKKRVLHGISRGYLIKIPKIKAK